MMDAGDLVEGKFSTVDYVVFSVMLAVSIGIGVISAILNRCKESTTDFLLGGREMPLIPVAVSLLGGIFSAISVLGHPTEVYYFGAQVMITMLGVVPGCLFAHQVMVPIFYTLGIVSLNEYVGKRFDSTILRRMSSMCHLLTKFFYMGTCLYAPSLALSTVTDLSTWGSMLTMGIICTFYITIGGGKAVVYTDFLQTLLMIGGVVVVVVICCVNTGIRNIWAAAEQGGRLEIFNLDTSPFTRHTFWSTSILGFYLTVYIVGLNQSCYQRFASVRSLKLVKRLIMFFMVGMVLLWFLFYSSGVVAYGVYHECDPLTLGRIEKPDQILPFLVMDKLGHFPGLPGLFVAAVYGGVLSSLSTAGNCIACLIWEDILYPWPYFARMSRTTSTTICRVLSATAGLSGIFLGMLAGKMGNVFDVINSVSSSIMGPMHGIFIAGICVPWVNTKGVTMGFLTAFIYNLWIVVGKFYWGRGSPPKLPLSIEGCPENLLNFANSTMAAILNNTGTLDSTLGPITLDNTTAVDGLPRSDWSEKKSIFDVSYCFFGVTGIAITVVVGSITSLCTGPLRPGEVDARTVSPTCARLYARLWGVFSGQGENTSEKKVESVDGVNLPMIRDNNSTSLVSRKQTNEESDKQRHQLAV